jgi:hypothetical protein
VKNKSDIDVVKDYADSALSHMIGETYLDSIVDLKVLGLFSINDSTLGVVLAEIDNKKSLVLVEIDRNDVDNEPICLEVTIAHDALDFEPTLPEVPGGSLWQLVPGQSLPDGTIS